jgi:hypothetical protein
MSVSLLAQNAHCLRLQAILALWTSVVGFQVFPSLRLRSAFALTHRYDRGSVFFAGKKAFFESGR